LAGDIHVEAFKEGTDGPKLIPAKLIITTRKGDQRPAVR
jgi:hypothetical protein